MNEDLLKLVLQIAQRMVEVGAEISRVEDSVTRLCTAYGAVRADVYVTTTNVIVTVETAVGSVLTQTRRIQTPGTDIQKLHELNTLVREITATTPEVPYIEAQLTRIECCKRFAGWVVVLLYAVIAGAFCLFFGGRDWREIAVAAVIGLVVGVTANGMVRIRANKLLDRFLGSFLACSLAFMFHRLGAIDPVDNVIIGNIMSMIPGIGLTNSLRDLFVGDVISGILRSIEAMMLALAIALGYVAANLLLGGVL